jgi:hypothetical protein
MNVFIRIGIAALAALGLAFAASPVAAQRGVGGDEGVARSRIRPEIVTLAGEVVAINIGPCERTTGRARIGIHLMVERAATADEAKDDGTVEPWNIHVGPQSAAHDMVAKFPVGTRVTVKAFRTEMMPANHYAAQSIASQDATATFRDDSLRPSWAGSGGVAVNDRPMRGQGPGYGQGRGPGQGRGRGYGDGRGDHQGWRFHGRVR